MNKFVIRSVTWFYMIIELCLTVTGQASELTRIFDGCHKSSPDFDTCIKNGFNELRPFFKTGLKFPT